MEEEKDPQIAAKFHFWRRIFLAIVVVVGLTLKAFGTIGWSHLIFAIISVPLTFPLTCYALYGIVRAGVWLCQPRVLSMILAYLIFCATLELYRVEAHSEWVGSIAYGTKLVVAKVACFPFALTGIMSEDTFMAAGNSQEVYNFSYNFWNIFALAVGIPFFIVVAILMAVASVFYSKGKLTFVGKVAVGAAVGTAAHVATKRILDGRQKEE